MELRKYLTVSIFLYFLPLIAHGESIYQGEFVKQNFFLEQELMDSELSNTQTGKSYLLKVNDSCSYIQSTERRNMVVKRKIFRCMTKRELNRVIDREPDNRHFESNGGESWHYHYRNGDSLHVFFDNQGRVESWSGWH